MKKYLVISSLFILNSSLLFAQSWGQLKQGKLAIGGSHDDLGLSIIQTKDGGYAITGYTYSYADTTNGDIYVMKLDYKGGLKWTQAIGGKGRDIGNSIAQTSDGGYIIAGTTNSFGAGNYDVYVIKLDSLGNVKWTSTIGGTGDDEGVSVVQANDGGYIVAGYTNSFGAGSYDMYVVKLDSGGSIKWTHTIGGAGADFASKIITTKDRGYVLAGYTNSFGAGGDDFYLVKLDSIGNLKWTKTIGGTGDDNASSLIQTNDGGYAIIGNTQSFGVFGGAYDAYLVRLDSTGSMLWTKAVSMNFITMGSSIIQDKSGNYLITGNFTTSPPSPQYDAMILLNFDSAGNFNSTKTLSNFDGDGCSITKTFDGGCAILGFTNTFGAGGYDIYMVKVDSAGNTCFSPGGSTYTLLSDSGKINGGGIMSSGGTITSIDSGRISSGGIETIGCIVTSVNNIVPMTVGVSVYPNPSNGIFQLEINNSELGIKNSVEVYNVLGEKIFTSSFSAPLTTLDLSGQPAGIYFYRIVSEKDELIASGKLTVTR